jgi:alginate O-acetyltransferase complex protein AlgI
MLFNSIQFLIFLPIVFFLYWFVANKSLKSQNVLLLASSYFFYSCWDWRFLFLLIFSTVLDYFTGIKMSGSQTKGARKFWFWLSIVVNAGFLGIFKYYNFFITSFAAAISHLGLRLDPWTIHVILPVGISFYTFHGLSYVIDVYNGKIKPERNFIDYSLFVSFFPLLVAGPIERATHLLPQIQKKRVFDYSQAIDGIRQALWGMFKKVVIADSCAIYVNQIYANSASYSGSVHVLGGIFFAFQIYCDFSGYSDIALGVARLFGIELLRNFSYPYFSRNIAEFWRRWHISLSSWFRDYLYIPLGGSRGGAWMKVRNVLIIFLVSGFWHGANWTFIIWGLLNALLILPSVLMNTNRANLDIVARGRSLPSVRETFSMLGTFGLTVFAWMIFRSENMPVAVQYISKIFSRSLFKIPYFPGIGNCYPLLALILLFLLIEWRGREKDYAIKDFGFSWPRPFRWTFYYALLFVLYYYALSGSNSQFIYFQF